MRPFLALITPLASGHVDNTLPGAPAYPDNSLPGAPVYPDQGLPVVPGRPSHPIARPPFPGRPVDPGYGVGAPAYPDNSLPVAPGTPENPIVLPPDGAPGSPTNPIVLPDGPVVDNTLPKPPGSVVIWIPGRGYVVVQPGGPRPDQGLPPTAQPKR